MTSRSYLSDEEMHAATLRLVQETPKLYPGDNIVAKIRELARPPVEETVGDGFELLTEAVTNFGYMREDQAMKWIEERSPLVAASVRRIGYMQVCQAENLEVIRGQFRAIFAEERDRARRTGTVSKTATEGIPHQTNRMVDGVAGKLALRLVPPTGGKAA